RATATSSTQPAQRSRPAPTRNARSLCCKRGGRSTAGADQDGASRPLKVCGLKYEFDGGIRLQHADDSRRLNCRRSLRTRCRAEMLVYGPATSASDHETLCLAHHVATRLNLLLASILYQPACSAIYQPSGLRTA